MKTDIAEADETLQRKLREIFGRPADPLEAVEERAASMLPIPVIVWEGDPQTFQFSYVSACAEEVLGYPVRKWFEPGFWAETIVFPADRADAVAFCALATGKGRDHDFQYRATRADGRVILLHDMVHVIKGDRNLPTRLRGVMTVVPAQA
jgi:PAS domain-containing protein